MEVALPNSAVQLEVGSGLSVALHLSGLLLWRANACTHDELLANEMIAEGGVLFAEAKATRSSTVAFAQEALRGRVTQLELDSLPAERFGVPGYSASWTDGVCSVQSVFLTLPSAVLVLEYSMDTFAESGWAPMSRDPNVSLLAAVRVPQRERSVPAARRSVE